MFRQCEMRKLKVLLVARLLSVALALSVLLKRLFQQRSLPIYRLATGAGRFEQHTSGRRDSCWNYAIVAVYSSRKPAWRMG
jgi:hypothetical protein